MGRRNKEKKKKKQQPFTEQPQDDETIALSKDELDNILSEADLVDEKTDSTEDSSQETDDDFSIVDIDDDQETGQGSAALSMGDQDDFDISGEIDELSPEDLESIELEDEDVESYTEELEQEIGTIESEGGDSDLDGIELEDFEIDGEAAESEEMNLDDLETAEPAAELSGGDEIEADNAVDIESLDESDLDLDELLGESGGQEGSGLEEPPVLGDESEEFDLGGESEALDLGGESNELDLNVEEDSFQEIDIDELESLAIDDEGDEGDLSGSAEEAEGPSVDELLEEPAMEAGESGQDSDLDVFEDISEDLDIDLEAGGGQKPTGESESILEPDSFEQPSGGESESSEMELTSEEESILSSDFDLDAEIESEETPAEEQSDDVVTLTGEELDDIGASDESGSNDQVKIDSALYNDLTVILKYMDSLLGELPEEKIKEFSQSRYFPLYKEIFEKLDLT